MTLTEGGAKGVLSALQSTAGQVEKVMGQDRTDESRWAVVNDLLGNMNETIQERIQDDQLPGDPTKADEPPPVPTDDGETPPPPPP